MPGDVTMRSGFTDDTERTYLESLIRADYGHCHPGETLADIKHRARFSKADKGFLRDLMEVARRRASAARRAAVATSSLQPNEARSADADGTVHFRRTYHLD